MAVGTIAASQKNRKVSAIQNAAELMGILQRTADIAATLGSFTPAATEVKATLPVVFRKGVK